MSKFSVLMSVYYREQPQFLREALDSIFSQTLLPDEVVLVKDGPLTKELDEVVEDFAVRYGERLHRVPLAEHVGFGRALNAGLEACSYDLVARMDSDDISVPNRFEQLMSAMEQYPEVDVLGSWIDEFATDPNEVLSIRKVPEYHSDICKLAASRSPMNHVSVLFRKKSVLQVGGYQHFYLLEDYYLWCRMICAEAVFANIPKSLVHVRCGEDMFRRRGGWRYAKSEFRLFRYMYQNGMIGLGGFIFNASARFVVRIAPTWFRQWVYIKLLR